MEAMGKAFAEIRPVADDLLRLRSTKDEEQIAAPAQLPSLPGDILNLLVDPASGQLYLAVVASPKREGQPLTVRLSPTVARLTPLGDGPAAGAIAAAPVPFRTVTISLQPGQGAFYRLDLEPRAQRKTVFQEDFADDDRGPERKAVAGTGRIR